MSSFRLGNFTAQNHFIMKHNYLKKLTSAVLCLAFTYALQAQYAQHLSANNVDATIGVGGNLFSVLIDSFDVNNPQNTDQGVEAPKGSGIFPLFTSTLWVSALDASNAPHCALQRYKLHGGDYSDGPIASTYDAAYDNYYKRVFKVTRQQITQHINRTFPVLMQSVDTNLLKWPAKGNAWVQSTYGVTISDNLAHFVDVNSNGIYDPWNGDFPALCSDEGVFFVVNDVRKAHNESGSTPLGIEIRGMAEVSYDFNTSLSKGAINNTVFVNYEIENKSGGAYHDLYIGEFQDPDLGCFSNDRVGCDIGRNLMYAYNGNNPDADCNGVLGYSAYKAAWGTRLLNYDMSAFGYFTNGAPQAEADPSDCTGLRNYLQGKWNDGTAFTEGGTGYGGSTATKFLFPGNPSDTNTWSEMNSPLAPGDRRMYGAIGPLQIADGVSVVLDMAFFLSYDSTATNLSIVDTLKRDADLIQSYFNQGIVACRNGQIGLGIGENETVQAQLFPNPSNGTFSVRCEKNIEQLQLTDLTGRLLFESKPMTKSITLHEPNLPKGVYLVHVFTAEGGTVKKLTIN